MSILRPAYFTPPDNDRSHGKIVLPCGGEHKVLTKNHGLGVVTGLLDDGVITEEEAEFLRNRIHDCSLPKGADTVISTILGGTTSPTKGPKPPTRKLPQPKRPNHEGNSRIH